MKIVLHACCYITEKAPSKILIQRYIIFCLKCDIAGETEVTFHDQYAGFQITFGKDSLKVGSYTKLELVRSLYLENL